MDISKPLVVDEADEAEKDLENCRIQLPCLPFQQKVRKDMIEICEPIFKALNITFFSQTRAFHDGQFTSLITKPDLTEHYINRKYPIYYSHGRGLILNQGIYIAAYMENQPSQHKIRQELRELYNVDHMIHVIEKHHGYDDMYTFATTPDNYEMVNKFMNNIDKVNHFLLYYKDKSSAHIKKATKITYTSEYFDLSVASTNIQINNNFSEDTVIKKIRITSKGEDISISQREFECLKYIAKNYTFKEIGKFLSLSPRTVETYINNLKYKLGCDNRTQLIKMAYELNLL